MRPPLRSDAPLPPDGPLTAAILDREGCMTPGCTCDDSIIWLHAGCHPSAGTQVLYSKVTATLEIICRRCKTPVARVKVAER